MDEISNNTLLFLAIIAIGISIFGIYTTLTNIGPSLISGQVAGTANVTIQQATTITINPSNINFTETQQSQSKNSSLATDVTGCSTNFLCGLNITNDGNVLVDITLDITDDLFTAISQNGSSMMCRVCSVTPCNVNNFNKGDTFGNSSVMFTYCNDSVGNVGGLPTPPTGINISSAEFIDALNFTEGSDNAYVDVYINAPADESTGKKGAVLSFTASANVNR